MVVCHKDFSSVGGILIAVISISNTAALCARIKAPIVRIAGLYAKLELESVIKVTSLKTSQKERIMRQWPVQDAKAKFSEMLDASLEEGPQLVSKRGEPKAVLISVSEWEALNRRAKPSAKEVLLAPEPRFQLDIPSRKEWVWRDINLSEG